MRKVRRFRQVRAQHVVRHHARRRRAVRRDIVVHADAPRRDVRARATRREIRATPTREQRESADADAASDGGRARATCVSARGGDRRASNSEAGARPQSEPRARDASRRSSARVDVGDDVCDAARSRARRVTAIALVTSSASGVGPTMVLASDFHATDAALAVPFERRSEREVKMRLIAAETQHASTTAVGQRLRGPDRGRRWRCWMSARSDVRLVCGRCEDGRRVDAGEDGFRYCANGYRVGERGDAVGRDEMWGSARRWAVGERGASR